VAPAPPPIPPPSLPPPATAAAEPSGGGLDLETLIAGRWLNRVGIIALLLAVAFFLKYAFENNWIGPAGRIAIGLLAGTLLLVWSQWLLGRGYRYFSEGIAGLGAGVLYLSLYAAWNYYHLLPQAVAFVGMMAVTAGMATLALGRNSQRIALLALAGGYATPLLVSTGTDQQLILFSYLLALNAGMLLMARVRDWWSLEVLAFLATLTYFVGWYDSFYDATKLAATATWATLFFAQFAALPVLRARAQGTIPGRQVVLVLANASWYLLVLRGLLWPERRWTLTVAVLALAAAHLWIARLAPEEEKKEGLPFVRILFAGLALTLVTLAIPIRLDGKWITIAWAVEGAVLVWSGFATRVRLLRGAGLILFAVTALRLFSIPITAGAFLLNARFATFFVAVLCFAVGLYFARMNKEQLGGDEQNYFGVVGVAINVFLLWALSMEVWDALGRQAATNAAEAELAQQLGLSLLWVLYATVLTVVGFRAAQAGLRWQGLLLFGLVVGKVFFYDLWLLERFYRIVSFVALGVVLLAVSFYYQRRLKGRAMEKQQPGSGG